MPITRLTTLHLQGMRIQLDQAVDAHAAELIRAWARAWSELTVEWDAALAELIAASKDGAWPSRWQISRAVRARRALDLTRERLDQLVAESKVRALQVVPVVTSDAASWQARVIASTLPAAAGDQAVLAVRFNRVDAAAIAAIVKRTAGRIEALSRPLAPRAVAAMKSTLIRGVALGENPRTAAYRMLERLGGDFDGGRNRALVIARTEMLDAHRSAAMAQDLASPEVVTGWQWLAKLDTRTCQSCWSMHGRQFPVDSPGPLDHQQGRCARAPVTKTWADLGFPDIEEPEPDVVDARAAFRALPKKDKLAILGPERLAMLNKGLITWDDLATRRSTDGWRDSYAPTPITALRRKASRR